MAKVIFIDRDGVINRDPGGWTPHSYVTKWEEFHFLPGSVEALKKLNAAGYEIVVISNQAGVGRGLYTKKALDEISAKMSGEIERAGARLKKIYYCVHHPDDGCECRKPKIGLFLQAEKELSLSAEGRFYIGDSKRDMEAGGAMGMKTILVLSGKTSLKDLKNWDIKPDYIFDNLLEATEFVIKEK